MREANFGDANQMSSLGRKQTCAVQKGMSATSKNLDLRQISECDCHHKVCDWYRIKATRATCTFSRKKAEWADGPTKADPARSLHVNCSRTRDDSNVRPLPQELSRTFHPSKKGPLPLAEVSSI
jgi:hypothetical protein